MWLYYAVEYITDHSIFGNIDTAVNSYRLLKCCIQGRAKSGRSSVMADTTNLSKEEELLLSGVNNSSLRTSLLLIREAAEKVWAEDVPRIIQDYTDHGIKHSQRVAGYALQLLEANRD